MKITKQQLKDLIQEELENLVSGVDTEELNIDEAFEEEFFKQLDEGTGFKDFASRLSGRAKTLMSGTGLFGKILNTLAGLATKMGATQKAALLASMMDKLGVDEDTALQAVKRIGTASGEDEPAPETSLTT